LFRLKNKTKVFVAQSIRIILILKDFRDAHHCTTINTNFFGFCLKFPCILSGKEVFDRRDLDESDSNITPRDIPAIRNFGNVESLVRSVS